MISKRLLLGLLLCMSIAAERAGAEELRVFVTASSFSERLDVILEFDAGGNVVNTLVPDDKPRWGITEQGNSLYVLETVTKSLVRYELDGTGGQQLATFANPTNFIESNSQGNLYVVDSRRNVSRLDSEGNPNLQFSTGREFPTGIDADADGNIYVAANFSTSGEFRFGIEKFDAHGAFVSQLVLPPDDFPVSAVDISIDESGQRLFANNQMGSVGIVDISGADPIFVESVSMLPNVVSGGISYNAELDNVFLSGLGLAGQFETDGTVVQIFDLNGTTTPNGFDVVSVVPEPASSVVTLISFLCMLAGRRGRCLHAS